MKSTKEMANSSNIWRDWQDVIQSKNRERIISIIYIFEKFVSCWESEIIIVLNYLKINTLIINQKIVWKQIKDRIEDKIKELAYKWNQSKVL